MNEHMEAAIEAGAFAINPYPFQGGFGALGRVLVLPGESWEQAVEREKRSTEYKAEEVITAALPHIRAMIAQEVRDYWDACGDLIDSNNGARLAFDAMAAQIAEGNQP